MFKIFDCSNSLDRPLHRGGGGPVENEIITYLKKYSNMFGFEFVNDYRKAQICFTNDVFPEYIIKTGMPLVKRMDGIFSLNDFVKRNDKLNEAAQVADEVIFISDFSRCSFLELYPNLKIKNQIVALNTADPDKFKMRQNHIKNPKKCIAIATDWNRIEKRFIDTINMVKLFNINCVFVGKPPETNIDLPNIKFVGYNSNYLNQLNEADFILSLSYKDPAPKTLIHGIMTGLPALYANSGGQNEIVKNCGLGILDNSKIQFEPTPFKILYDDNIWNSFLQNYDIFIENIINRDFKSEFEHVLNLYFSVFKKYI